MPKPFNIQTPFIEMDECETLVFNSRLFFDYFPNFLDSRYSTSRINCFIKEVSTATPEDVNLSDILQEIKCHETYIKSKPLNFIEVLVKFLDLLQKHITLDSNHIGPLICSNRLAILIPFKQDLEQFIVNRRTDSLLLAQEPPPIESRKDKAPQTQEKMEVILKILRTRGDLRDPALILPPRVMDLGLALNILEISVADFNHIAERKEQQRVILKAYKMRMLQIHPDKISDLHAFSFADQATRALAIVNEAKSFLERVIDEIIEAENIINFLAKEPTNPKLAATILNIVDDFYDEDKTLKEKDKIIRARYFVLVRNFDTLSDVELKRKLNTALIGAANLLRRTLLEFREKMAQQIRDKTHELRRIKRIADLPGSAMNLAKAVAILNLACEPPITTLGEAHQRLELANKEISETVALLGRTIKMLVDSPADKNKTAITHLSRVRDCLINARDFIETEYRFTPEATPGSTQCPAIVADTAVEQKHAPRVTRVSAEEISSKGVFAPLAITSAESSGSQSVSAKDSNKADQALPVLGFSSFFTAGQQFGKIKAKLTWADKIHQAAAPYVEKQAHYMLTPYKSRLIEANHFVLPAYQQRLTRSAYKVMEQLQSDTPSSIKNAIHVLNVRDKFDSVTIRLDEKAAAVHAGYKLLLTQFMPMREEKLKAAVYSAIKEARNLLLSELRAVKAKWRKELLELEPQLINLYKAAKAAKTMTFAKACTILEALSAAKVATLEEAAVVLASWDDKITSIISWLNEFKKILNPNLASEKKLAYKAASVIQQLTEARQVILQSQHEAQTSAEKSVLAQTVVPAEWLESKVEQQRHSARKVEASRKKAPTHKAIPESERMSAATSSSVPTQEVAITYLLLLLRKDESTKIAKLLREGRITANSTYQINARCRPTLLSLAVHAKAYKVVQTLIAAKADLELKSSWEAQRDEYPLQLGVSEVFVREVHEITALQVAVQCKLKNIAMLLLKAGANVNAMIVKYGSVLHIAVLNNDAAIIDVLLAQPGIIVDRRAGDGTTPFLLAVVNRSIETATKLIAAGVNINNRCVDGSFALYNAVKNNDSVMVAFLLRQPGVLVDEKVADVNPLYIAANEGFVQITKQLLDAGTRVHQVICGLTPLQAACAQGRFEIVHMLTEKLKEEADVSTVIDYRHPDTDLTALAMAVQCGEIKVVNTLLAAGAKADLKFGHLKSNLLHIAAQVEPVGNGHIAVICKLVQICGVDSILESNNQGETALHLWQKHPVIHQILTGALKRHKAKSTVGTTSVAVASASTQENALLAAAQTNNSSQKVTAAKQKPAATEKPAVTKKAAAQAANPPLHFVDDAKLLYPLIVNFAQNNNLVALKGFNQLIQRMGINFKFDNRKNTLLYVAAHYGATEVVAFLLQANAPTEDISEYGTTALYIACERGFYNIVRLLLTAKANIECRCYDGYRPLHVAVQNGHYEIVDILLKHQADPDAATDIDPTTQIGGATPLSLAIYKKYANIVERLIAAQADIEKPGFNQYTPLAIAAEDGNVPMVHLLLAKGAVADRICHGRTACEFAKANDHAEVVTVLAALETQQQLSSMAVATSLGM